MDPIAAKDAIEQFRAKPDADADLSTRIAVFTAVFAFAASFSGLMSNRCTTRGMIAKNEAVLAQAEISDQWAYYQSRNIRIEIAELVGKQTPARLLKVEKMTRERDEISQRARVKEKERDSLNEKSTRYLELSKLFASALVLLQVAVLLVPLTLIVKKMPLLQFGCLIGVVGIGYLFFAYVRYFQAI